MIVTGMTLRNWKQKRKDPKTEAYWKRQEEDHKLNSYEEYQKEWNFIETDYDWKPSSNKLMGYDGKEFYPQYGTPAFAFETKLVKYLVPYTYDTETREVKYL